MKTLTKLALAALAMSTFVSATVFADDIRTVERYNNHGTSSLVYRQCDINASGQSSSVAVYSQGRGVGAAYVRDSSNAYPQHLTLRDNAHGGSHYLYTAE
jgi:hypothetical protein